MAIPSFKESHLENISRLLVECLTHAQLTQLLKENGFDWQTTMDGPRWHRLTIASTKRQEQDKCGNNVGVILQAIMSPARFTNDPSQFSSIRDRLNVLLAFNGLQVDMTGKLHSVEQAKTLSEAGQRASRLKEELTRRKIHPDVLKFCREDLLQENYFHAVLEATKSIADKIRDKSGLTNDGADLINGAFGGTSPKLALNSLRSETERSEQKGFMNLVKGTFGTFRNPTAHAPKITWPIEFTDAIDLLTLVSYLHRRIDSSVKTGW